MGNIKMFWELAIKNVLYNKSCSCITWIKIKTKFKKFNYHIHMNTQRRMQSSEFQSKLDYISHIRAACPYHIISRPHQSEVEKCPHACLPGPQKKLLRAPGPGLHSNTGRVSQPPKSHNTSMDSSINLCVLENFIRKYINL